MRPRRNRSSASIRHMVRETTLCPQDFVWPVFVKEGEGEKEPIGAMPGCFRLSIDLMVERVRHAYSLGLPAVALFPVIEESLKDPMARSSLKADGLIPRAIQELKAALPEVTVITDVAMDPYSSEGHDGVVREGQILNDETLEVLGQMAVVQARAGADLVAPSDMMDGRVDYLRRSLDREGFSNVGILSYAVKYASAFYGPFREALDSAPKAGDKKTYQMDPGNRKEALREVALDVAEGADLVMVKPALAYLDIISDVKHQVDIPVAAYNVSGEYAMIKAAAERGWLDERACLFEMLLAIKRAGADLIFSYAAIDVAEQL